MCTAFECVLIEESHLRLVTEVAKAMALKKAKPTTRSDVSIQTTPAIDETAAQINDSPERRCAAIQTEPPDDEGPTSTKNVETTLRVDLRSRVAYPVATTFRLCSERT